MVRGGGNTNSDEEVDGKFALDSADCSCELENEAEGSLDSDDEEVDSDVVTSDESESVDRERVDVDCDDSISEWASIYFSVRISSTRGVLNDTFFSAGNLGRPDILRESTRSIGLFDSIEFKLWEIWYGIVAELVVEADESEEALGVLESWVSGVEEPTAGAE
jgi:hypothetical protein